MAAFTTLLYGCSSSDPSSRDMRFSTSLRTLSGVHSLIKTSEYLVRPCPCEYSLSTRSLRVERSVLPGLLDDRTRRPLDLADVGVRHVLRECVCVVESVITAQAVAKEGVSAAGRRTQELEESLTDASECERVVSTRLVLFATGASSTWDAPWRPQSPLQLPHPAATSPAPYDMSSSIVIARAEEPLPTCTPHLMPFHIDYSGPAPISTYFRVKPAPPPGYLGKTESQNSVPLETTPSSQNFGESQTSTTSDTTLVASSSSATLDSQGDGSSQVSCLSKVLLDTCSLQHMMHVHLCVDTRAHCR